MGDISPGSGRHCLALYFRKGFVLHRLKSDTGGKPGSGGRSGCLAEMDTGGQFGF